MVATGIYWGAPALDALWIRCAKALAHEERQPGTSFNARLYLRRYPATLVVYGAGIAALLRRRYEVFRFLLLETMARQDRDMAEPLVSAVGTARCFFNDATQLLHVQTAGHRMKTPGSD